MHFYMCSIHENAFAVNRIYIITAHTRIFFGKTLECPAKAWYYVSISILIFINGG